MRSHIHQPLPENNSLNVRRGFDWASFRSASESRQLPTYYKTAFLIAWMTNCVILRTRRLYGRFAVPCVCNSISQQLTLVRSIGRVRPRAG